MAHHASLGINFNNFTALIFHFNDPSPAVRRAVVSSIALNKLTIGHILARTRDVNDNVRRNAYLVFSKIKALNLTIKYRVTILERGLQDRSGENKSYKSTGVADEYKPPTQLHL